MRTDALTAEKIGSLYFDENTILEVEQKGGGGAGVQGLAGVTGGLAALNLVTGESTVEVIEEQGETITEQAATIEEQAGTIEEQAATIEEQAGTIEEQAGTIEEQAGTIEEQAGTIAELEAELAGSYYLTVLTIGQVNRSNKDVATAIIGNNGNTTATVFSIVASNKLLANSPSTYSTPIKVLRQKNKTVTLSIAIFDSTLETITPSLTFENVSNNITNITAENNNRIVITLSDNNPASFRLVISN